LAEKRQLIVGIDPGTTVGLAILGLEGDVHLIYSSRTCALEEVTNIIIEHGTPLIVASDVNPLPSYVQKVCHLFEAVPFVPKQSMSTEAKREIIKTFAANSEAEISFRNSHEKDALAASLKALESYEEKFRWIDRKLTEEDLSDLSQSAKALVVRGSSLSSAIEELKEAESEDDQPERVREAKRKHPAGGRSKRGTESVELRLRRENRNLGRLIDEREERIESLEEELEKVRSESFWEIVKSKEVDSRNRMIKEMKRSLSRIAADRNRMRKRVEVMAGSRLAEIADDVEIIPVIPDLSRQRVSDLGRENGEIPFIIVEDASGTGGSIGDILHGGKTKAVFIGGKLPPQARESLEAHEILVVPRERLDALEFRDLALARKKDVESALSGARRELNRRLRKRADAGLRKLVEGYRREISSG